MTNSALISIETFCIHHKTDVTFIDSLQAFGLIETVIIDDCNYIHEDHLQKLETLTKLHNELDINAEGLDVISHMLNRIRDLQNETLLLRSKLDLYE